MRFWLSEYQKKVWRHTLSSIKTEYGKYALFLVGAEILGVLLLYLIQVRQSYDGAAQNFTENIFLVVAVNVGILLLIVPWIRFFEIPENIHNEQAKKIDTFWPEDLHLRVSDSSRREVTNENGEEFPALILTAVSGEQKKKIVELEGQIYSIHQTSIDPDTREAITLLFFAEQRIVWDDGTTTTELRPEDRLDFYLGYLDARDPPILRFGEGGFAKWLFEREAVYQFSIQFMGKLEGETEFKRFYYMQVLYAHPSSGHLTIGHRATDIYDGIPEEFVKVIDVAELGYWYDYSSPFRRQQEEKRRKEDQG